MFIALDVTYSLIQSLRPIVPVIQRADPALADQIRRAATSISLNLAEGQRSAKGNKQKHYAIAHGSANEVKSGLMTAQAWGWLDVSAGAAADAAESLRVLDRLLALLWRLTH